MVKKTPARKSKYDYLFIKDHEMIQELTKFWNENKEIDVVPKERPKRENVIYDEA